MSVESSPPGIWVPRILRVREEVTGQHVELPLLRLERVEELRHRGEFHLEDSTLSGNRPWH